MDMGLDEAGQDQMAVDLLLERFAGEISRQCGDAAAGDPDIERLVVTCDARIA